MSQERRSGPRLPAQLAEQLPSFLRELLGSQDEVSDGGGDGEEVALDDEQREVVEALIDLDVPEHEAIAAVRSGRVPLVIAQHRRHDKARYTLDELAEKSGVPADVLRDVWVAMGLPLRERYNRSDLRWARQARQFLDVMPVEALVRSARARGTALAAVARADLAVIRDELMLPMRQAGADDLTMAVALAEAAESLEDLAKDALVRTYELTLDHQLDSELVAMAARSPNEEVEVAVGFVDVEGYTALSSRIDPRGLDAIIDAFENRVVTVTNTVDDVSPVKYLGDAVMLVAADPVALAGVMLELTTPVDALADAPLRGGLAFGPVLIREGDYYGAPVNLAARLTDLARTWSVLADEHLADALDGHVDVKPIRPTRVRGMGVRRPLALLRDG